MHRCHFCGKILHEVPFHCRRCGNIFCTDHHLPENHHCSKHHFHDNKPHHRFCGNCGRKLTGLPYKCHRCGVVFCDNCRLPENHVCKVTPPDPTLIKPPKKKLPLNHSWKKIRELLTLKNFTILSILFMLIGFLPSLYPLNNYQGIFQSAFEIGALCFVLAYFLYALKCWGATSQICAFLMITIPLFAYFLSTSKIPDSTTNILFYLAIQFCFYAIISAILLYLSDKVKMGIELYIFKRDRRSHWNFTPELSYSVIGVLVVSFLVVNYGGVVLFSDNVASFTQSLQNINAPSTTNLYANDPIPSTTVRNPQIITQIQSPTIIPTTTPKLDYKQSPKTMSYYYIVDGNRKSIGFTTYGGLSNYFSKEDHSYYDNMEKETIMELLENDYQNDNIQPLIEIIRKSSTNPNDQANIAISLVQHIPYNWNKYYSTSMDWYYPYETLYNNKGVCADKSLLLAYLLNELGFDTVLFEFSNHMAVGIKSSSNYDFYDTGYAFIETTRPTIITYVPDTYLGGFRVTSNPHIIHLNGGKKILDVSMEYRDAIKMKQLEAMGEVLDQSHYAEWLTISNNYDLQYDT